LARRTPRATQELRVRPHQERGRAAIREDGAEAPRASVALRVHRGTRRGVGGVAVRRRGGARGRRGGRAGRRGGHRDGAPGRRRRRGSADDRVRSEAGRRSAMTEPRLRERLPRYEPTVRLDAPSAELRFADVTAHAIGEALETVAGELTAIESLDQGARLHEARLAGKRLRYLIEPWREIDGAREIIRQLKELQDALGELNDLENLGTTVSQALDDATLDRAARRRDVAGEDTL